MKTRILAVGFLVGVAAYAQTPMFHAACASMKETTTIVGVTSTNVPGDGGMAQHRTFIDVCNSANNDAGAHVKCRGDGTGPDLAVGDAGVWLFAGNCMRYATPFQVKCVSDTANTYVHATDCSVSPGL